MPVNTIAWFAGVALLSGTVVQAAPAAVGSIPCSFPKAPQFLEPPTCPPTTLTKDDAVGLGHQLAPELRFHPLEESFLLDPRVFFDNATLFSPRYILSEQDATGCPARNVTCSVADGDWRQVADAWETNRTTAMFLHRSWLTTALSKSLTEAQKAQIVRGDPFDAQNRSTSSVPFTIATAQDGRAWIFTYHHYYAWNGCSNQAVSTRFDSEYDVIQYFMCPTGVHEGDWEHVGLFVCPGDLEQQGPNSNPAGAIRRVHYSQHGWLQEYDCGHAAQCPFEEDALSASKLVAYVGLFSHALYPSASSLWVYASKRLSFLYNMDGVYIADRTAGTATSGRRWVPTQANVRYIPPAEEISGNSSDAWALYPGNWGALKLPLSSQMTLTCFFDNFTRQGKCPSSPSFDLLKGLSGAISVSSTADAIEDGVTGPIEAGNRTAAAAHRTGPLQREYSYLWLAEKAAPIWKDSKRNGQDDLISSTLDCPAATAIPDRDALDSEFRARSVVNILWGILASTLLIACVLGLLLLYPMLYWHSTNARKLVEGWMLPAIQSKGALRELGSGKATAPAVPAEDTAGTAALEVRKCNFACSMWLIPAVALLLFLAGLVQASIGLVDLFAALDDVYEWHAWSGFRNLIIIILAIGLIFDTALAVLTVCGVPGTCCACCLPGRATAADHSPTSSSDAGDDDRTARIRGLKRSIVANALSTFVLVLQLTATVVLFALALLIIVGRSMLGFACEAVTEFAEDFLESEDGIGSVCVDLSALGLRQVSCGDDVVRFCKDWEGLHVDLILWGAYSFLLSHLIMLLLIFQRGSSTYVLLTLERLSRRRARASSTANKRIPEPLRGSRDVAPGAPTSGSMPVAGSQAVSEGLMLPGMAAGASG